MRFFYITARCAPRGSCNNPLRRVLGRVLDTVFEKVARRVLKRCLAVGFKGFSEGFSKKVPRSGFREGAKKKRCEIKGGRRNTCWKNRMYRWRQNYYILYSAMINSNKTAGLYYSH